MTTSHKLRQENPNLNKFQVTFFSPHYRPVACILETEKNFVEFIRNESTFKRMAIVKICQKRGWTKKDFEKYEYNTFKYKRIKDEE